MQLTQKKTTLQFKALDQTLQTINRETNQKEALTYRCADMDRIVPSLMGVSKVQPCAPHKYAGLACSVCEQHKSCMSPAILGSDVDKGRMTPKLPSISINQQFCSCCRLSWRTSSLCIRRTPIGRWLRGRR